VRALANLRTRIGLMVLTASLLAAIVAALGMHKVFETQLDSAVDSGLAARANDVAAARTRGDTAALAADPFAQLLGPDGSVLARSPGAPSHPVVDPRGVAGRGARVIERDVPLLGGEARLRLSPVPGGTLVVGTGLADFREVADRLLVLLVAALAALLVFLVAGAWVLVGAALRPVGRMTRAAAAISGNAAHERLPAPAGTDEIAELGHTLNGMLDRIDAAMARERRFLDDASHELRTPLTVLRGELELAVDEPDEAVLRTGVRTALEEAHRLSALAEELLVVARQRGGEVPLHREGVDLLAWTRTLLPALRTAGPAVEVHGPDGCLVALDDAAMQRVMLNLVTNAARAGAGCVNLTIRQDASHIDLLVDDDGPGFPADLLPHAFERFSRADPARAPSGPERAAGTGLGLAIVDALVRGHDGHVEASNDSPLGGARVRLRLPAMSQL
jgi:signal transduction histidine kinase